jgi:hypothetical protein
MEIISAKYLSQAASFEVISTNTSEMHINKCQKFNVTNNR